MQAVEIFELVLALLAVVIALYWLALKLRLPPAAALLVGGGALAFAPGLPNISLDPQLALALFLPPLLIDGAYSTALGRARRYLPAILALAIGAVVFTTAAVGLVAHWIFPVLPWGACFALGAIVSPPDAVSARVVLKDIPLPRRLSALIEGESLLNDATGLILFRFAVAAALTGAFHVENAIGGFFVTAIGGVLAGLAAGAAWYFVANRLKDPTLIIISTSLLGWAAYLAGDALHVSGVIAAVTAGLVLGWYQHTVFSAAVRLVGSSFHRILVFVLEAMVFVLIGFSLRGVIDRIGGIDAAPLRMVSAVAGVILTTIVARFVWVFGSDALLALLRKAGLKQAAPLGWRQAIVLSCAGMRGVVTLAIPLALPLNFPGRDLILLSAFAVIFVTVVVQGSSLGWLLRWAKPVDTDPPARMDTPAAEAAMARARVAKIEELAIGPNGEQLHPEMLDQARRRLALIERYAENAPAAMEKLRPHFDALLLSISAGRAELIKRHRAGDIEDEVLHDLERDLDVEEIGLWFQRGQDN